MHPLSFEPQGNTPKATLHPAWVRSTHWISTISILLLFFSGAEILMVHPRLYWGEAGNDLTRAWIELPISRNHRHGGWEPSEEFFNHADSPISQARNFQIFNRNSWGRSLHFMAGWGLAAAGAVYLATGFASGHFRRHLIPRGREIRPRFIFADIINHVRFRARSINGGPNYGLLQKCAYVGVVFGALPGTAITGFCMSPAITAAHPWLLRMCGGFQSARSIHFILSVTLMVFLAVHVLMVIRSGFRKQMRGMIYGEKQ
jgi:thiosulfate reductase cytochrome b subunit